MLVSAIALPVSHAINLPYICNSTLGVDVKIPINQLLVTVSAFASTQTFSPIPISNRAFINHRLNFHIANELSPRALVLFPIAVA
ncbi:MAG: hypothetical protein WCG98_02325 [bacterium]